MPKKEQAQKAEPDPPTFVRDDRIVAERAFENYVVRIYRDVENEGLPDEFVEILKDGSRVYAKKAKQFQVGSLYETEKKSTLIPMGRDITGDGVPDVVISEDSGGAHCCLTVHVFQIGKEFRKIATIEAEHGGTSDFADLDGDSTLEFVMNDWTFAYWKTSFADSPAPKVILRFRDGEYRLAPDLMRKDPPSDVEISRLAEEIRGRIEWKDGNPPSDLWRVMLDLIYTGHADMAWSFFEKAWLPRAPGKAEFLREFRDQLSKSPHWSELRVMVPNLGVKSLAGQTSLVNVCPQNVGSVNS